MLKRIQYKLIDVFYELLKLDYLRYWLCFLRWSVLKRKLLILSEHSDSVGKNAIAYNLTAFENPDAAFGMGKRMSLIIYPIAAIFHQNKNAKVLIIGARTEDDIFWARAMGLRNALGLDLFTYSSLIEAGDMHNLPHADCSYDAILLGWVLAYSTDPMKAITECIRVLKPGGYLAIGMETLEAKYFEASKNKRYNQLNTISELKESIRHQVIFEFDEGYENTRNVSIIFKK